MKIEEVISRLRDLKEHCITMIAGDALNDWEQDALALEIAIECLEITKEVEQ